MNVEVLIPNGVVGSGPTRSPASDASAGAVIRDGHQELLEAFLEFARDVDGAEDRLPDSDVLRAAIAFLRQSLLPFARWEEEHLNGCVELTEDTAFEHAFLNAEVDALAAAVTDLDRWSEPNHAAQRIRRCVHRIEAVLELHVQKAVDRESPFSEPTAKPAGPMAAETGSVRHMDLAEIHRALHRNAWAVLCTVGQGIPYGVPVSYGFDGRYVYVASGPGRKHRNLEAEAAVCLTVAEVKDGDHWSSVVVTGEARPVSDIRGKLHALNSIRRQRATVGPPSATELARIARASIFRITPDEITGRMRE